MPMRVLSRVRAYLEGEFELWSGAYLKRTLNAGGQIRGYTVAIVPNDRKLYIKAPEEGKNCCN